MNWFQIYAFYISPFVVLGIGLLVYYIAVRDSDEDKPREHLPGE